MPKLIEVESQCALAQSIERYSPLGYELTQEPFGV